MALWITVNPPMSKRNDAFDPSFDVQVENTRLTGVSDSGTRVADLL